MGKRTIEGKYLSSSEKILGSLVFTRMSVREDDTESERYYCDPRSERKRGPPPHRLDARAARCRRIAGIPGVLRLCRRTTWGQWFPAAGLARTSRRLPRALLSATVLPLLVIAAAFVTESHAVLVAAPLGGLRSGTDYCRRHQLCRSEFLPRNVHYANNGFVLTRLAIDRRGDCAAFDLAQQRVLASTLTNSRCLIPLVQVAGVM